ncbi:hypothetical protein LC065_16600 [Halobacillus litoralis]|uniref:hypothetical protein n=1 Tax=Halobacillus litoralis TaxID=45668 RepID=UPI001CFE43CB|nr:hypothetical protein [Halobacillus litoralis]WLR47129.1 hypothetical protein LC065_16600 [Halobacillus litoralis]
MMTFSFEKEAEMMVAGIITVTFMAFTIIFFLMKEKEDKRPYGWMVAHLFFSLASLVWAFRTLYSWSSHDEPQSMALAAMSFHLWLAAFVWCVSILCLIVGVRLFKETEENE